MRRLYGVAFAISGSRRTTLQRLAAGTGAGSARLARSLEQGAWPAGGTIVSESAAERELWLIVPDTTARAADPQERVVARADGVVLIRRQPE